MLLHFLLLSFRQLAGASIFQPEGVYDSVKMFGHVKVNHKPRRYMDD